MGMMNDPLKSAGARPNDAAGHSAELIPGDYLRAMKSFIARGKRRDAYELIQHAVVHYPDNPVILSYFGYLDANVGGKYRSGIEKCGRAIAMAKQFALHGEDDVLDKVYPLLHLNLGRAYLSSGKKKEAAEAYRNGLQYDKRNKELLKELQGMGIRRRPPIAFLDRSNMVNVFLGRLLHKTTEPSGVNA